MSTLWLPFAADSSLPVFTDEALRQRFETAFDAGRPDSPWSRALARLGIKAPLHNAPLIYWHHCVPYIDWSHMVALIGAGVMRAVPDAQGGIAYTAKYRLRYLLRLVGMQWNIARYILRVTAVDYQLPEKPQEQVEESIALGLAILALTLRLPAHDEAQLARWLAQPGALPSSLQRTITQMDALQRLRGQLSQSWHAWLGVAVDAEPCAEPAVPFFWDQPSSPIAEAEHAASHASQWKGIGVAGAAVTGRVVLMQRTTTLDELKACEQPLVLVFPTARPDTVNYFELASAVVFGAGGALCHACTIAREQNLTCVTALGGAFIKAMEEAKQRDLWLNVNGASGEVGFV